MEPTSIGRDEQVQDLVRYINNNQNDANTHMCYEQGNTLIKQCATNGVDCIHFSH